MEADTEAVKEADTAAKERKTAAKAAMEETKKGKETVIGADINGSHPYKDGTFNDPNMDESPQQVAERKHAEKAAAWKKAQDEENAAWKKQNDRWQEKKAQEERAKRASEAKHEAKRVQEAEEKKAQEERAERESEAMHEAKRVQEAERVHEEKATAWKEARDAAKAQDKAQEEQAQAVQEAERTHAEKAAAWKKAQDAEKAHEATAQVVGGWDEPPATEAVREAPSAEPTAKKSAKKAKKSFYITNDPFFVVNGKKGHFWLAAGAPTKLLSVPFPDASHSVALLGETFGDGEASQWFKTYTLAVNGEHLVKVEVSDKPGELSLMRTMKVWTNGREMSAPRDAVHHVGYNVTVMAQALPIKKIGSESAEEVVIRTPAVSFTIWTQQANKFDEVEKRVQYAHLNMEVDGGLPDNAEGVAAEFAGVQPMTAETEALLEMPYAIAQERKQAKHMRKWIKSNKRRLGSMSNIAALGADASASADADAYHMNFPSKLTSTNGLIDQTLDGDEPVRRHRTRRQRRHGRRSKRSGGNRLMKSWERKLAVHARKEARGEARHLIPA